MLLLSATIFALQTVPSAHGLNTAGWIFISLAWLTIIGVAVFCFSKVIRLAETKKRAVKDNLAHETSR